MNAGNLQQIGKRIRDERTRLDLSQAAFSGACDVNRGTLATWEKGEQTPTAAILSAMAGLGVDVLYVITGQRTPSDGASLTAEEATLVTRYRQSSPVLRAYLQEFGLAPAAGNTVSIGGDVGQSIAGDQRNAGPVSFSVGKGRK